MNSIAARLSLAASLVLTAFVLTTTFALQSSIHERVEQAQYDRLQGVVYGLLGATEVDDAGQLSIAEGELPDPRLNQVNSGLYAQVTANGREDGWRSASLLQTPPATARPAVGEWRFERGRANGGSPMFVAAFTVEWATAGDSSYRYTFTALSDTTDFDSQLASFDQRLWLLLGAFSVLLLAAQLGVLRWGLSPLRKLTKQVHAIESGQAEQIEGPIHRELQPLSEGLNALLGSERGQRKRYRNALDDLAHSLKTPLAVLRNLGGDKQLPAAQRELIEEHSARMQQIVDYQLQRAATRGQRGLTPPQPLAPLLGRLARTLEKVFADKGTRIELQIDDSLALRADEGELMELFGNLMENAAKYGAQRIRIDGHSEDGELQLSIEDDGPGFPESAAALIARGTRADTRTDGQGIGLAVAAEITAACDGQLLLDRSEALGGARVLLRFNRP